MMSKKQWFVLLCLFIIYLLLGASIFFYVESQEEIKRTTEDYHERQIIEEMLRKHYKGDNKSVLYIFNRLSKYCGKPVHHNMSEDPPNYKWDFYHSLFFVITVVSTIGYGNLAPTTMFTRVFMIFYGLIGISMNGIVMVTLGEYFGKSFKKLYRRWKSLNIEKNSAKLGLIGQIILYAVPGLTFFIFLPSTIISFFEGWNYDVAVYFAFVTLTTIGFGDYVAGVQNVHGFDPLIEAGYQIFLLVWVIGGIGYVLMVIGFITQGMRSKKIAKIEKMLSENIKRTPHKIRHELRTLLHEFLFMRVKPVYKGDFEYTPTILERSQSCPDLTIWRKKDSPSLARKRAMSECYKYNVLEKVQSETELDKIDKERTFKPSDAFMKQKDLLLKVVDALSATTRTPGEGGIHCFSDREILASERYDDPPDFKPQRRRAMSDIKPPLPQYSSQQTLNTWYGEDAAKAINFYRNKRAWSVAKPNVEEDKPTFLQRIQRLKNVFRKDDRDVDVEKQNEENIPEKKSRAFSIVSPEVSSARRNSIRAIRQGQVLEQTSIADFIRALSAITVSDNLPEDQPRRKLGTASLTPPNYSPKSRKMSILPHISNRRTSLIPTSHITPTPRRLSLRPVEENILNFPSEQCPPISEAMNSFGVGRTGRRFSVKPTNTSNLVSFVNSPVKNQVNRRKRHDS
ncbi:open rectifier K[+] channel 1 isoform X2 [Leptinotarsa decemlineata]